MIRGMFDKLKISLIAVILITSTLISAAKFLLAELHDLWMYLLQLHWS